MATTAANRGKKAEAKIKQILKDIENKNFTFTANKNPDAHAAGGRAQPVAGDFQAFKDGCVWFDATQGRLAWSPEESENKIDSYPCQRSFIIEVKETKHDYRLPHANYSEDKVARVMKRVHAGTEAVVAILHTTTGLWRLVPQAVFAKREGGSWDLRSHEHVDINAALRVFLGVA